MTFTSNAKSLLHTQASYLPIRLRLFVPSIKNARTGKLLIHRVAIVPPNATAHTTEYQDAITQTVFCAT